MTETPSAAKATPWWRGEWASLVAMLLLLTLARTSFANHYQVPSGSMEPNLMPGDRVVVNMMAYGLRVPFTDIELYDRGEPVPGDIVVFKSPEDGTRLIKRVVAVGGQAVALHDGRLWVDGQPLFDADATEVEHFGDRAVTLNLAHGGGPDIDGLVIPAGMAWCSEIIAATARTVASSAWCRRSRCTHAPKPSTTAAARASAGRGCNPAFL